MKMYIDFFTIEFSGIVYMHIVNVDITRKLDSLMLHTIFITRLLNSSGKMNLILL